MRGCRAFTNEEVTAILGAFSGKYAKRDRALFLIGIKSGFRCSEMLSLTVGDILQHDRLVDRVYVRRKNMKGKAQSRSVILHPEAKAALSDWLAEMNHFETVTAKTFLFKSRKGNNCPMTREYGFQRLKAVCDSLGIGGRIGVHSLRKTFAGKVYDFLNHDLVKTQRALGHRCVSSTVQYLSFREEEIDAAVLAA